MQEKAVGEGYSRIRRHAPAGMWLAVSIFLWATVVAIVWLELPPFSVKQPIRSTPVAVQSPGGTVIGWWRVEYPTRLRKNEEGSINVRYIPGREWGREVPLALSAEIRAAGFEISPRELMWTLSGSEIHRGFDANRVWTITPKRTGKFVVVLSFGVSPAQWTQLVKIGAADPVTVGPSADFPVDIECLTIYGLAVSYLELLTGLWGAFVALLALPPAGILLKWYLERRGRDTVSDSIA